MRYSIEITKKASKALLRIPSKTQRRIIDEIWNLAHHPFPRNCKKLVGRRAWRIRVGDYRVIYEVFSGRVLIVVLLIGQRKSIYRRK